MKTKELLIGIDVGSTTVKAVARFSDNKSIVWQDYQRHETKQAEKVLSFFKQIQKKFPDITDSNIKVFMTGSGGMTLAEITGSKFVQEVSAVCAAAEILHPNVGTVIDLGGQDSKIIIFKEDEVSGFKKKSPSMNDKCAGGTGAVIDKIGAKLNLSSESISKSQFNGMKIHHIAGKCGVFAETDINGLQKQGIPTEELMASLYQAIVVQNLTVLTRGHTLRPEVILLGGPNSYIPGLRQAWQHHIKLLWKNRGIKTGDKSSDDLVFAPDNALYYAAIGAIEFGLENHDGETYKGVDRLKHYINEGRASFQIGAQPGLFSNTKDLKDFLKKYKASPPPLKQIRKGEKVDGFIGLDIGSTSTKAVLLDKDKNVLFKSYQLSKGNPIDDTRNVLGTIEKKVIEAGATLKVNGLVTTGYAKDILKEIVKADSAIVETVAHTASAMHYYKEVDVICDVGGQDIKIIILKNGKVKDFKLNTQCSAGNGYFLQSTAEDFGIPVQEYADAAFKAKKSPTFGYGCAVFLQSDIVSFQRQGWKREEILAGLAKVLPKNIWLYVAQIPNFAKLGVNFVLQGGTQYNLAAVKAQVDFIESRYKGKDEKPNIVVHKHAGESGAIGAAIEAIRLWENGHKSTFIGLESLKNIKYQSITNEETRCNFCKNKCLRTFIDLNTHNEELEHSENRIIIGNECEKGATEEVASMRLIKKDLDKKLISTPNLLEEASKDVFDFKLKNEKDVIKPARIDRSNIKIGIPRVLLMYNLAPLFRGYFEHLGIKKQNIIFSDYTDESMYRSGCTRGSIDPCYPAKVCLPHVHNLIYKYHKRRKLDYIFMPMICDLGSELVGTSGEWVCPAVVASTESVKAAFKKEDDLFSTEGIDFVNSFLNLADPKLFEVQMFKYFKDRFKLNKSENRNAVNFGLKALAAYKESRQKRAQIILEDLEKTNKLGIVMLGRSYHNDPGINHGIFTEFQKLGYPILTQDDLPTNYNYSSKYFAEEVEAGIISHPLDISDVWKNSLSTNVNIKLWAAKFVARHPNLVAVELSNFKCGHDAPTYSVIESIIETSGTPYFSFKDIDENKPTGSIKLRVETIDYFLQDYAKQSIVQPVNGYKTIEKSLKLRVKTSIEM